MVGQPLQQYSKHNVHTCMVGHCHSHCNSKVNHNFHTCTVIVGQPLQKQSKPQLSRLDGGSATATTQSTTVSTLVWWDSCYNNTVTLADNVSMWWSSHCNNTRADTVKFSKKPTFLCQINLGTPKLGWFTSVTQHTDSSCWYPRNECTTPGEVDEIEQL